MNVKTNIPVAKILAKHGLGNSNKARKFLASQVARVSDPYVPMSSGSAAHMKNRTQIKDDGSALTYPGPYAHYHWVGDVMAGRAPKHYTGQAMDYHGAPMRGKEWVNRAMNDHAKDVEKSIAAYVGGKPK